MSIELISEIAKEIEAEVRLQLLAAPRGQDSEKTADAEAELAN